METIFWKLYFQRLVDLKWMKKETLTFYLPPLTPVVDETFQSWIGLFNDIYMVEVDRVEINSNSNYQKRLWAMSVNNWWVVPPGPPKVTRMIESLSGQYNMVVVYACRWIANSIIPGPKHKLQHDADNKESPENSDDEEIYAPDLPLNANDFNLVVSVLNVLVGRITFTLTSEIKIMTKKQQISADLWCSELVTIIAELRAQSKRFATYLTHQPIPVTPQIYTPEIVSHSAMLLLTQLSKRKLNTTIGITTLLMGLNVFLNMLSPMDPPRPIVITPAALAEEQNA